MIDYWDSDRPRNGPWLKYNSGTPGNLKAKNLGGVQPGLAPIGFAYDVVRDPKWRDFRVMVPLWFVALLGLILPGCWMLARHCFKKSRASGLCRVCGYDLRATPERCPECGTVPEAAKEAAP